MLKALYNNYMYLFEDGTIAIKGKKNTTGFMQFSTSVQFSSLILSLLISLGATKFLVKTKSNLSNINGEQ